VTLITGTAFAEETDSQEVLSAQSNALDLDKLTQSAKKYMGDVSLTDGMNLNDGLYSILQKGTTQVSGIVKKAIQSGVILLVIVMLTGLADHVSLNSGAKMIQAAPIAAALAITAVAVTDATTLIGLGTQAIETMESFSKVLLPTIAAATAASGAIAGASARQLASMLFSDVLITLINRFLLPLVYTYIAACTAHAAIGNEGLKRIAGMLKWMITSVLTLVLLIFVGYLTVSGVIAGTSDAITIKATKFTMSSMVPVVGGIISDAAETVLAGAAILKNTIGLFGMLAVISMCLAPFLQLGIHYIIYKITAALASTMADSRISGLIDGIGSAFGLVLGMTASCALLLLVSMVSAISVTTG
jgi:stage III sporulation protein AE